MGDLNRDMSHTVFASCMTQANSFKAKVEVLNKRVKLSAIIKKHLESNVGQIGIVSLVSVKSTFRPSKINPPAGAHKSFLNQAKRQSPGLRSTNSQSNIRLNVCHFG